MTLTLPADHAVRTRIAEDLETTLIVEAAAGTGKTTALISRMLGVLASGRGQLGGMVAVTFTEAAAGELKLRLRTEIERLRQHVDTPPEVRQRLTHSLEQLEEARIGTIHGFCADLLRERPVEARVDPRFEVAAEDVARMLAVQAFDRWFEQTLAAPGEGVRRLMRRRSKEGPRRQLLEAARSLIDRRDFTAAWTPAPFAREPEMDGIVDDMRPLADAVGDYDPSDYFAQSLQAIHNFVADLDRRERIAGARDYDGLEAELIDLVAARNRHWGWSGRRSISKNMRDDQRRLMELKLARIAARDALHTRIKAFDDQVGADLAPRLKHELNEVVERYEQLKARAGYLDFVDLLLRARDLVRDDGGVRADMQARFSHLFVDEFQDTDPVQAELLLLLASDDPHQRDWEAVRPQPGKLFLVGDPKQSIYRFRRADVALYKRIVARLVERGAVELHLSVSFRSAPAIQQAVNAAFERAMDGSSPSQASYVALQPHRPPLEGQPVVVVLPAPDPYGVRDRVNQNAVHASLPETVAAFIDWLLNESGWKVTERGRSEVAVRPQHVCLLFKQFRRWQDDVTRPYVRALEARHVPHILVGGSALHSREEVEALRNALAAIERPDDDLSMYATLRGPFFALDDAALLAWRHRFRNLHPFRKVPDDLPAALGEVAQALAVMRELHARRNRRPIAATIDQLLSATRAAAGLAIWPSGEQALANLSRVMNKARRAERSGVISFRAFVDALDEEAESGEVGDAPIVEEGTEGVRLMTVHRAKGLEFPIVVMVDPMARATLTDADRWVDSARGLCAVRLAGCSPRELLEHRDEEMKCQAEEAIRLVYVGATRARDMLVVTGVADVRPEGWLSPLHPAVYPIAADALEPIERRPPGCPQFGGDTVRVRSAQRPVGSVSPGLHAPEVGGHRVVWWDPRLLALDVRESLGLKQSVLLRADEAGTVSRAGIEAHDEWKRRRLEVRERGARPSLRVVTATEAAALPGLLAQGTSAPGASPSQETSAHRTSPVPTVRIERVASDFQRPHGKRFGVLVHAVLAAIDLADAADLTDAVALHGRMLGATDDEIAAARQVVTLALQHDLLRRAAAAEICHRELPVARVTDDGTLVEGVLDAAFVEGEGWTVVDFKTDLDTSGRLAEYRNQLAHYALALAQASGREVVDVVLLQL